MSNWLLANASSKLIADAQIEYGSWLKSMQDKTKSLKSNKTLESFELNKEGAKQK